MLDRLGRDVVTLESERVGATAEPRHVLFPLGQVSHAAAPVGVSCELSSSRLLWAAHFTPLLTRGCARTLAARLRTPCGEHRQ